MAIVKTELQTWYERHPQNRTARHIEVAVAKYFDPRRNIIVPNVSWGFFIHECDLFLVTRAGYGYEVEIKASRADIVADAKKRHAHNLAGRGVALIRRFFFAIPDHLLLHTTLIPERAGILVVDVRGKCRMERDAQTNTQARTLTLDERFQIARLGTMRIWTTKAKMLEQSEQDGAVVEAGSEVVVGDQPTTAAVAP
jgi:hypothetical protein